jgi:hypothetical protein
MKIKCPCCGKEIEPMVYELKDTDSSSTKPIIDSIHYLRQTLNQCKVMGIHTAVISRLFNQGNWKWLYRPKDPVKIEALIKEFGQDWDAHPTLDVTRIDFTQEEIDNNWAQMIQRRDLLQQMIADGKLLPQPVAQMSGMSWECKDCPYKGGKCTISQA